MRYDAIIVLGGGYTSKGEIPIDVKPRIDKAVELFFKKKARKIILSSGYKRKNINITEADLLFQYCLEKGVPEADMIKEELSLDTVGNAFFCRKYITDLKNLFDILVVTSDFHMERTKFIFKRIFGKTYRIKFVEAMTDIPRKKLEIFVKKEKRKMLICKEFFKGLKKEDIKSIEKRLLNFHPYYRPLNRRSKHDSIFDGFRIKKLSDLRS